MSFKEKAKSYTDPEKMAADYLAAYFDRSEIFYPINPFRMLRDEGILFTLADFHKLEGVYIAASGADDIATVGINANRPITRQRFTAAHELCHHFHDSDKQIACPIGIKNSIERFADSFAAAVTMGPAGRTDMFYFSATNKLREGKTIQIFNYGNCKRDFTYLDDIVEGVVRVMGGAPEKKNGEDGLPIPPYAVYNIGGGQPENLLEYVSVLQEELVRAGVLPSDYDFDAHKELVGMQPGDVPVTYADSMALERDYGFRPTIDIRTGLRKFAEWYKEFYLNL